MSKVQEKREAEIISVQQITPTVKLFQFRVVSYTQTFAHLVLDTFSPSQSLTIVVFCTGRRATPFLTRAVGGFLCPQCGTCGRLLNLLPAQPDGKVQYP